MPRVFNNGEVVIVSFVYACQSKEKQHIQKYLSEAIEHEKSIVREDDFEHKYYINGMENALHMIEKSLTNEEEMCQNM